MACDRCEESREAGYAFCMHCGEPLDDCPDCDASREKGYDFCPTCGRRLTAPDLGRRSPYRTVIAVGAAILAILLISEAVALVAGAPSVWSWAEDVAVSILVLKPELYIAGYISGLALQVFWVIQVVVLLVCLIILFRQTLPALRAPRREILDRLEDTPLYWMAMVLCATLVLNVVCALPSMGSSLDVDNPIGFVPDALYAYANAAVWEEVITRIAFIGVPMAIMAACHLRKDFWRYLLGGFGMSRLAIVLIFASALVFGFAHMSGWGLWKVLPTFISGIALGYLYVRFGIHVSIMMHFAIDYMAVLLDGAMLTIVGMIMFAMLLIGIVCIMEIAKRLWTSRSALREMPAVMPPDQESIFSRRE